MLQWCHTTVITSQIKSNSNGFEKYIQANTNEITEGLDNFLSQWLDLNHYMFYQGCFQFN